MNENDRKPSILIVDDEIDICEMIAFSLNNRGFETMVAYDAQEAFELYREKSPDIIVSDVRMPKGGGIKLLKDIRAHSENDAKVILITGYCDNSPEEVASYGVIKMLQKPVKLGDLIETIEATLNQQ